MTTTTIQFRAPAEDKKAFSDLMRELGLTPSVAFLSFMKKALKIGGIPFNLRNEEDWDETFSPEKAKLMRKIEKDIQQGKNLIDSMDEEAMRKAFGNG